MSEPTQDGLGSLFSAPDAGNQGPGEVLRRAREAQRISIEMMAAKIKVSVSKLEALEAGRFDQLPDANFTRALAMTLCRALNIDSGPVLAGMPAARPATLFSEVPPLNQPFKASRASMALFDRSSSVDWSAFLKPQWLAPAALLLAAVVLFVVPGSSEWPGQLQAWWHSHQTATVADPPASEADAEAAASVPVPANVASSVAEPWASAASDAAASGVPAPASVLNANGSMPLKLDASDAASGASGAVSSSAVAPAAVVGPAIPAVPVAPSVATPPVASVPNSLLNLRAKEATWVEVKDAQGNRVLGRLLQRDETVDLSVQAPLALRVGNAAGLSLSFRGQVVDLVPYTRNNIARFDLK